MDILRARVTFRDRPVTEVLDLALRFIVTHAREYGRLSAFTLLPGALIAGIVGSTLGWVLGWVVAIPLAVAAETPFTILASRLAFERDVGARDVLATVFRTGPAVIVVRLLALVGALASMLVLVVPGFWVAIACFFVPEVILLERAGAAAALGRAQRIATTAFSDVLVGILLLSLVSGASVLLADVAGRAVIGDLLQFKPPAPIWVHGGSLLAIAGLFLQAPFVATARFFLYLNVRTRAEGWDIQMRFAAIASASRDEAVT